MANSEFISYLPELFDDFAPVQIRRMFGGHGVFFDGLMFGLVDNDTLYLKADSESAHWFEALNLEKFSYIKQGKTMKLSYYQAPEEVYDDRESAALWARRAFDAALRADSAKRKPNVKKS